MDTLSNDNNEHTPPKIVFIVPYRNRAQQKFFFAKYMSFILEDVNEYEIFFSHQCDSRTFNRGAVKNIGFLAVKQKYPNHYQDINFVFNDVDTIPFNKLFDYKTTVGVVKHHYGFKTALGGIVVIKGSDFEKINGFPCYWGWGLEDAKLQTRCIKHNIKIDRSCFYEIGNPHMLQLFDGVSRIISKNDSWRKQDDVFVDGLITITNLNYNIRPESDNPHDNTYNVINHNINYINIQTFNTFLKFEPNQSYNYDLRTPKKLLHDCSNAKTTNIFVDDPTNWTNIPYYPTMVEKRKNTANLLLSQGKPIPQNLLDQIKQDESVEDIYNKSLPVRQTITQPNNKYSPHYANSIGYKSKATASVNISLGGIY